MAAVEAVEEAWVPGEVRRYEQMTRTDAVLADWEDAYLAFVGAFATPVMRHKVDNEYAEDARQRIRAFHDAVGNLRNRGSAPAEGPRPRLWTTGAILWDGESAAIRYAERFNLEVVPVPYVPAAIKEPDCHD